MLEEDSNYDTIYEIIKKTDFDEPLNKPGPFTLFDPTDAAYALIPNDI